MLCDPFCTRKACFHLHLWHLKLSFPILYETAMEIVRTYKLTTTTWYLVLIYLSTTKLCCQGEQSCSRWIVLFSIYFPKALSNEKLAFCVSNAFKMVGHDATVHCLHGMQHEHVSLACDACVHKEEYSLYWRSVFMISMVFAYPWSIIGDKLILYRLWVIY